MSKFRKPIVVVGSISMDMVSLTPRLPAVGETVIGTSFSSTPGGKGANQAVTVARLGYPVHMVGKVGADAYAEPLLHALAHSGVGIDAMERGEGSSGLAHIFLEESGRNSIVIVQGVNANVDRAQIDRHANLISAAGMVLCQLELPLDTVLYTIGICAAAGVPLMLDPAPAAPLPDEVFSSLAWFTPNENEAALYDGASADAELIATKMLNRGVQGVVLKRGAEGAYVATRERAQWVSSFAVDAVDTVAAGDCFNGALAVGLMEGLDPWSAARSAAAAASLAVTRRGAQASLPTREEVDAFLTSGA